MSVINYYKLNADFAEIYLEDSWVLEVIENSKAITFKMEIVLTERHPQYSSPKTDEQYCYKRGEIIFSNIKQIKWNEKTFRGITDSSGEVDYGNIDSFTLENEKYHLNGEWGDVVIESDTPTVKFNNIGISV